MLNLYELCGDLVVGMPIMLCLLYSSISLDQGYEIMTSCWSEKPTDRPTFSLLRQTLELMLQKNVPYLELSQMNEQSLNCYNIPDESGDGESDDRK